MGGGCHTPYKLDICYGLIPPYGSDIVNPLIPSKPRLYARFGLNMMKCKFTSPPTKVGVKGKAIHGHIMRQTEKWA